MSKPPKAWRPFEKARAWVRSRKPRFKDSKDYKEAWKRREIPTDIPSNPNMVYVTSGWRGMCDFLGTESKPYWDFERARSWAHKQRENGMVFLSKEWARSRLQGLIPEEIPGSPHRVYAGEGWKGWDDFLGKSDKRRSKFELILALQLSRYVDVQHGHVKVRLPTGRTKRVDILLPGQRVVLECDGAYYHRYKFVMDCADTVELTQAGYRVIRIREQSRQYQLELVTVDLDIAIQASLKSEEKVFRVLMHLVDLGVLEPRCRERIKAGGDVVNAGCAGEALSSASFVPYGHARSLARELGLRNKREWEAFTRSPAFETERFARVPVSPRSAYREEFLGWGDFLGTGNLRPKDKTFVAYDEAKRLITKIAPRITGEKAFREALKSGRVPSSIPRNPRVHYDGKGWVNWGDFLGTGNLRYGRRAFLTLIEAKRFVRKHLADVTTCAQWNVASKNGRVPANIPRTPFAVYRGQGWKGWGDFLGTNRKRHQGKPFANYEDAKLFRQTTCPDITTRAAWLRGRSTGRIPSLYPSNPWTAYRGRGWRGGDDFFGRG